MNSPLILLARSKMRQQGASLGPSVSQRVGIDLLPFLNSYGVSLIMGISH
jgi:hypothetical protein